MASSRLGESELCTLLLRPERRRKATAFFIRSLLLRRPCPWAWPAGAGGIFAGLLSSPESVERRRARLDRSRGLQVYARGTGGILGAEGGAPRQKSWLEEKVFLRVLTVTSFLPLTTEKWPEVALGSLLSQPAPPEGAGEPQALKLLSFFS